MQNLQLNVVIVGRPNVGKSTLFNSLTQEKTKKAIVNKIPGTTRDRNYTKAILFDLEFGLIDTAGIENQKNNQLTKDMMTQVQKAIEEAQIILFLVDVYTPKTKCDDDLAKYLRKNYFQNTILVANKYEKTLEKIEVGELFKLGFSDPILISAKEKQGFDDLYNKIKEKLHQLKQMKNKSKNDTISQNLHDTKIQNLNQIVNHPTTETKTIKEHIIKVAIVGKPNAGKSTLINSIINEKRLITGDKPGITRDAISVFWKHDNVKFELIDTAGMRKKIYLNDELEKISFQHSCKAIDFAEIVILIVSEPSPLDKQELHICHRIIKEGRALILAFNKWDLINKKQEKYILKNIYRQIDETLPAIKALPCVMISALKKININQLLDDMITLYHFWNKKIPTSQLNQWLIKATNKHNPKLYKNKNTKIKYITQIKTRPPTFVLYTNFPQAITQDYQRYLINSLRKELNLPAVPIRTYFRKSNNPYEK